MTTPPEPGMTGPPEPEPSTDLVEVEVLDGVPVAPPPRRIVPAAQAAAAAATGFLAGAATLALLHRRDAQRVAARRLAAGRLGDELAGRRPAPPLPFTPGSTYLVRIRVLGRLPE